MDILLLRIKEDMNMLQYEFTKSKCRLSESP